MNTRIRNLSLAALLAASTAITACTPAPVKPEVSQPADPDKMNGPQDGKEVEAFADPLFAEMMKKDNVAGSNFVVVKDGKVLVNKGYGYADKEKKIPVDPDTVFQIASVSKTFTALAVMQMVDEGKLDLNRDVNEYLGGLKVPNTTGKPLTLFEMLNYTSGVDKPDITTFISPDYIGQDIPMKSFIAGHMPTVVRPPGEAYTYDNFGFLLAGLAVENVSGMRFDEYMKTKVFEPLGMKSTSVRYTPELKSRMAQHYSPTGELQPAFGHAPTDGPQGSILSTGTDMANYLVMQLGRGKFGDKQIVSAKSMEPMHTYSAFADAGKTIPIATVGFEGYYKELMNGQHVVLKGGNMPGHSSLMVLIPEQNTAFYMSYNSDTQMSVGFYEAFMDHYFPEPVKKPAPAYQDLTAQDAQKYLGLYQNTRAYGLRTQFTYQDGKLIMDDGSTGKHTLRMITPTLFDDEAGEKLAFQKDAAGSIKYFYYTSKKGINVVGHSQKVEMKPAFADVPADSPYKLHIDHLNALTIMGAARDNLFEPARTLTQGEFADLLIQAHGWYIFPGQSENNKKQMMADIPGFESSEVITRQMAAAMIQNLKQAKPASEVRLTGPTDEWAAARISALLSQGIADPDTKVGADGSADFRSRQPLLRQEAAALLDKAFGAYSLPIKN
ncbi:serine hydrolase domain-containing protein [Paenibacillus lutrae]|uniref:Serine hydrolase n=1 Tax=Paenibacillus lutrae TaxID=2078573 RepID=A0A7X3FHV2_9BACL|nr:serine hydrolase [Paenibacillus lutrae]MVO99939.1 serine hydrolase [Paenibacillus lutrae]